ncbi:hypothetical protein K9L27_02065 [Candidatus Gracilibacteria bacterium]|nr:hypothetical protein [Candidatus Gracilibacteria bacterium]
MGDSDPIPLDDAFEGTQGSDFYDFPDGGRKLPIELEKNNILHVNTSKIEEILNILVLRNKDDLPDFHDQDLGIETHSPDFQQKENNESKKFINFLKNIISKNVQDVLALESIEQQELFQEVLTNPQIFSLFLKFYPEFFEKNGEIFAKKENFPRYLYQKGVSAIQSLEGFKMGGDKFLIENILSEPPQGIQGNVDVFSDPLEKLLVTVLTEEYSDTSDKEKKREEERFRSMFRNICELETKVIENFGAEYRLIVILLLHSLDFYFGKVERMINIQIGNYGHLDQKDQNGKPYFPSHLLKFFVNYADISQELIRDFPIDNCQKDIETRSHNMFHRVLNSKELLITHERGEALVNLFEVLVKIVKKNPEKFPWFPFSEDFLQDTPFDKNSLTELIAPEIPRADLVQSLKELSLYKDIRQYEDLSKILFDYKKSLITNVHEDKQIKIIKNMRKGIKNAFQELKESQLSYDDDISDNEVVEVFEKLVNYLGTGLQGYGINIPNTHNSKEIDEYNVPLNPEHLALSKMHIFLRLLHPKTIARNVNVQKQAIEFIDYVRKNINILSENEKNLLILSLEKLFYRKVGKENFDLDMDIPLKILKEKNKYSLRSLLEELSLESFDDDIIAQGIQFDAFQHKFRKGNEPLFPLLGRDMLEMGYDDSLGNNLNNAEKGIPREYLLKTAKRLIKAIKKTSLEDKSFYEKTLNFCKETMSKCFQAYDRGRPTHTFYIDSTATTAFERFFSQCIDFGPNDNAVFSKEEYQSIINVPLSKNSEGVKFFDLHTSEANGDMRAATGEEIFERICSRVNKNTKIIVLSSLTRFGNVPLSNKTKKNGKISSLVALRNALKEKYPNIPLMIDGSQAIARTRMEQLNALNPDIYLLSGNKAMGTKQAGFIALSKPLEEKLFRMGHSFISQENSSTIPLEESVAFALGLLRLAGKSDPFCLEGNLGENKKKTLHEKISEKMKFLTTYTLKKFQNYSSEFVKQNTQLVKEYMASKDYQEKNIRPEELFSCKIFNPLLEGSIKGGMVVLYFPNISSERLSNRLKKDDFEVKPCLGPLIHPITGNTARKKMVRISFDYLTETKDIDAIFEKILTLHGEILNQKLQDPEKMEHIWKYIILNHDYDPMDWYSD